MNSDVEKLLEEDTFEVFLPDTFELLEKAGEDIEETRPIGGFCSTEHLDRQEEVVVAKGLCFDDFINFGYFNDNHKQDTSAVLGYPRMVKLLDGRWWTEGNLIKGYAPADRVWDLAKALKKSKAPRRLGFSIEGKVMARDENTRRILKAKVRNVAITNCPVNTNCTWDILAKAFGDERDVVIANKAVTSNYGSPRSSGSAAQRVEDLEMTRNDMLSVDDAVHRLRRLRPHLSKSTCARIVELAMR